MPPKTSSDANRQALIAVGAVVLVIAVIAVVSYVSNLEAGGNGVTPPTVSTTTTLRKAEDEAVTYRGRTLHCADIGETQHDRTCDFMRFYFENPDLIAVPATTTTTETPAP